MLYFCTFLSLLQILFLCISFLHLGPVQAIQTSPGQGGILDPHLEGKFMVGFWDLVPAARDHLHCCSFQAGDTEVPV